MKIHYGVFISKDEIRTLHVLNYGTIPRVVNDITKVTCEECYIIYRRAEEETLKTGSSLVRPIKTRISDLNIDVDIKTIQ